MLEIKKKIESKNGNSLLPDNVWAYKKICYTFGIIICCIITSPYIYTYYSFVGLLPLICILSMYINKITFIMHECAHNTLFSSSRKNKFWGNFCGYFLASDFLAYKRNHWIHHQIYGEPGDPQGNDYMGLKDKRFVGMIIFLLRPLIGWNIFKLIAFNKSKKTPKKSAIFVKRIAFTGLIQFVLGLLSSNFLKHPLLFFLYPIGAATFALFFAQLRGFIEHISPHAIKNNNEKFVRTHLPNFFDNLFLYDLNFNYHVEHHLNPSIPACHLPTLFEEKFYIEKDPEKFYFSFSKSSFETLSLIMREKMGEKYEN